MNITCPLCKTRYSMASKIAPTGNSTVVCVVCNTQIEIIPRGILYLYIPKVVVRLKGENNGLMGKIS